jgi:hypothetical protein
MDEYNGILTSKIQRKNQRPLHNPYGILPERIQEVQQVLFSSQYTKSLRKIFSFLPATTVFMAVGDRVLSLFSTSTFCFTRKLLCTFHTMEAKGTVTGFSHAMMLFSCNHGFRD